MDNVKYDSNVAGGKMPVYICDCGTRILIVPDVSAMNEAIRNHLDIHRKLTGKALAEEDLAKRIIGCLSETL
jgi:hypothetical protein